MASLDARSLYLHLVCLIALLLLLIGSVQLVRHGLNLLLPDPPMVVASVPSDTSGVLAKQYRVEQEKMAHLEQQRSKRQAIRGFIVNLALVLLSAGVYRVHWRRLQT
ncbi:hypothetical protein [Rhodothermus bifroesti]|uniref:Uncharacterized protein n=1 Tax=Rhodothermus marinus TaxID=29549 RepID=A0A7V2AZI6_RHOMR|nr:hypothetical protein [Rhodothermus bifroesti]GBD01356.1 hypothetical protein HRbin18_01077 [bacterium HR18]